MKVWKFRNEGDKFDIREINGATLEEAIRTQAHELGKGGGNAAGHRLISAMAEFRRGDSQPGPATGPEQKGWVKLTMNCKGIRLAHEPTSATHETTSRRWIAEAIAADCPEPLEIEWPE